MNDKLIRMAADLLIPVGERASLINSLYEVIEDAKKAKEMALQANALLLVIHTDIVSLHKRLDDFDVPRDVPRDVMEIAEETASEVAAEVAMDTVVEMNGESVNLSEGFEDTRETKGG